MSAVQEFDQHADTYDAELNRALSASGETKKYFAHKRIEWLKYCLNGNGEHPRSALDYGCGIGDTSELLLDALAVSSLIGIDTSPRSLELAAARQRHPSCRFLLLEDHLPCGDIDLAYCNGVFHHIAPAERASSVDYVWRCLRPG